MKKFKEEMSVVQIAKQKEFEQRQQEFQQSREQERLQEQQLWPKNQGYRESQQQQNWQSPQSCIISSVSPRSCIPMSPIQREDTPRPKPYSSLSFSLPKLQVPKFGGKKISRSLELPKRFEDGKLTDMGGGIRHCNSSVGFGAGAFSISRIPLTSHGSYGPPSYTSSSTVTAEAGKLMHSSLGGPSELPSQSHSAALSVKMTGSPSGLASLAEKIGTHSINVSGHSLASDALNRLKSNNTGVSNGEVKSICPYFEKAKRSLPQVASKESNEHSVDNQKKRLCQSVPSVFWSENAELQRSSPSVKSSLSFQNKESWKVYMSSLLQSPEIVYTKPPASLKAHEYEATGT
ncbi:uncharacterized protein LOC135219579 isoform X1 [Macrobrachium nipponense]|uniref:uncharacterized protein LOC135219579 isoform X1 n=1 Tax=Macrobrachium nipponense TaxID=159736 RepID=UPI0030C7EFFF